MASAPPPIYRFADLELDVGAYELRCAGRPVRLERRPMDLLILLVGRHGQLVTRNEIAAHLWGAWVFVDAEMGVNTAVRKLRQALQDGLDGRRLLETVTGKGYRFCAEVLSAAPSPPADERVTLAVMPFEDLDHAADREYLSAGLTEEAIAAVGQIDPKRLIVVGRTSVMAYRGSTRTIAEIGRELGAAYLLESSVRSEGPLLRIVCRLTRVDQQVQVWSASFDSQPSSVLAFQRDLARAIAEQVRLQLSPEWLAALSRRQSRNPEAFDLYLRGRHAWYQMSPLTTRAAVEHFARATALDPSYALAWAGQADAFASSPITGDAEPRPAWQRAQAAVEAALRAEPELAEAHTSAGIIDFFLGWDWHRAEAALRRATELDPNLALAFRTLGVLLAQQGRYDEARPLVARARALEPMNPMHHAIAAQAAFSGREYVAAVELSRHATVIDPGFWIGYFQLGQACELDGQPEQAMAAFQQAARLSGGNSKNLAGRAHVLARLGRQAEAQAILEGLRKVATERYVPPFAFALVHLGLGEHEAALEELERAEAARDVHLVYLPVDPKWDALRDEPRFAALVRRCFGQAGSGIS
ncbi:MAG TPA: winged helix-turn-helix domain-containing protein [Thermoanaerobaculia bacterium]|nr:winged helix-turn-helix domain-containing protein [Thermoanaerobaculia bacterium]